MTNSILNAPRRLEVGQKVKVVNVLGKYPDDSEVHMIESFEGDIGVVHSLVEASGKEPSYTLSSAEQGVFDMGGFCGQTLTATFGRDELQLVEEAFPPRMQIIGVAYTPMNPMLEEDLKSIITELDYCSYEQHGDEFHLTDLGGGMLPKLVENGLITCSEAEEIISKKVSHLVFEG